MKTKLASVLGLAVLMACFICGSSFVYADDVLEAASSAMQTLVPDATANGVESVDKLPSQVLLRRCRERTGDAQTAEAGQSPSAVSEIEPSTVDGSHVPGAGHPIRRRHHCRSDRDRDHRGSRRGRSRQRRTGGHGFDTGAGRDRVARGRRSREAQPMRPRRSPPKPPTPLWSKSSRP